MKLNNKNKLVRPIILLSMLSLMPLQQGCTDEEVATTIGAIVIGGIIAGGVAGGGGGGHGGGGGRRECVGGYRERCHEFRDYRGYLVRECRSEWDDCLNVVIRHGFDVEKLDASATSKISDAALTDLALGKEEANLSSGAVAQDFSMSFESAENLLSSLEKARDGDIEAILALGLSRDDLSLLSKNKMPTETGIQTLAKTLNQDVTATTQLVSKIVDFAKKKQKAIRDFRDRR